MDDTVSCPICDNILNSLRQRNKYLHFTKQVGDYIERTCSHARNHTLRLYTNIKTNKVEYLKFSLDIKYSKFLELDYVNNKCRLILMKDGEQQSFLIEKFLEPDFPALLDLKRKVALLINFL